MHLRRITNEDLPQVEKIQARIIRREVPAGWRERLAQHVEPADLPGLVAEVDGKVVGFILGEIKVGRFGAERTGWIEMMGVQPEQMGTGVGHALARALLDYFQSQGVYEVQTSVLWDSGDMLAFFKKLGFDRSPFINLQIKLKA